MRTVAAIALAAALGAAGPAQAAWPERQVTLIVPFAAGGITDILARLTASRLQEELKRPFIVENAVGAAGILAAERVLKAPSDGHTLLFTPIFQITMGALSGKTTFDPLKDFKPIIAVGATPFVITVNSGFPAKSLSEFIAQVKKQPGKLAYASAGSGSLTHVSSLVFLKAAGLDMLHVPYRGVAPAFNDLLAGHVVMLSATPVEIKPHLASGKVRPLAVTDNKRSAQLPDVPPITETVNSQPVITYNGLLASAQVPQDVVDTASRILMQAEKDREFRARLDNLGVEPVQNTPEEFAKIIAADLERGRAIAGDLGLTAAK
jgi:tripartite-type tricarboxylate transporter receptor subunit TctC